VLSTNPCFAQLGIEARAMRESDVNDKKNIEIVMINYYTKNMLKY